ncbi:MAG: hypothetical protein B7Z66_13455 [Chromatiales bacterium 21-64-14]|nr:MAG: hypothetical protein B7Z66_13455 [Chromatiales bacterium 21-64-14]HQU17096.1 hypothetical protein [Gammaproteobacteria bacterium]
MKHDLSRRAWLKAAGLLLVAGGAGRVALAASPVAPTPPKASQKSVHYRLIMGPNQGHHCMDCRYFRMNNGAQMMKGGCMGAGSCQVVAGKISPMGYCSLYTPTA